jgi:deoxyribodipyrimidine photo-lyase
MLHLEIDKVDAGRASGVGRWVQEIAWRDFYTCILCAFPRVGMGRPFLERFSAVVWEDCGQEEGHGGGHGERGREGGGMLEKWKDGKTGVPIVDAAMRCLKEMGWLHNRMRMIAAMFLSKDLMIDWRAGERVS